MAIDILSCTTIPDGSGLDALLHEVARTIGDSTGFQTVAVDLYRPAWDDFEVVALHGSADGRGQLLGATRPAEEWHRLLDPAWECGGAYLVPHGAFDRSTAATVLPGGVEEWQPDDALFVPLRDGASGLIGIVSVDEPESGKRPDVAALSVLVRLAAHAARAIEATQANEAALRHQKALEALFALSATMNATSSVDEVLQAVCDGIRDALGFELVVVELTDETTDRYRPVAAAGADRDHETLQLDVPRLQLRRIYDADFEVEGCYLLTREDALARVGVGPTNFESTTNGRGPRAWDRHWLVVPLHGSDGEEIGFIWVDNPSDRLLPARERLLALRLFANQAVSALVNSRQLAALRQASEDRRTLIDRSPVAIVRLDANGRIVSINPAAEELYGYRCDEVVGREPPWLYQHELPTFRRRFAEQLGADEVQIEEFTDLRRDGRKVQVRAYTSQLYGPDGEPSGVVASLVDVTPAHLAAAELAGRHRELEALYDTSLGLIEGLDASAVLEKIVANACELLNTPHGYLYLVGDDERLHGVVCLGRFAPFLHTEFGRGEGVMGRVSQSGEPFATADYGTYEHRVLLPGTEWLRAMAVAPLAANRTVTGVLGVATDGDREPFSESENALLVRFAQLASLTLANARLYEDARRELQERRQAEGALRVSQELYRKVVENSTDSISLLDLSGGLVYVSPSQERMLGYDAAALVGTAIADLLHPEDLERVREALGGVFGHESDATVTARIRHRDGHWVLFEGSLAPIFDSEGSPELMLAVSRDVTERERLAEQLRETQKMEAVGRLAGGIAHDFNNLLTAIGGYGELALASIPADAPARRNVLEICRAADRASALTRQLLAYSRKQVLQPDVVDLNAVVGAMESMLAPLLGERVTLVTELTELPESLWRTRADRGQVEQVLMNLTLNARDAMPDGGTVVVETANTVLDDSVPGAEPGEYVRLSVIDSGSGMEPETLARAFEPFFTTKGPGHGTGLGLASVYGIVTQTGGGVLASSEPGNGSRFDVYLPRVEDPDVVAHEDVRREPGPGSETVLLVEDEEIVRDLVREMLERSGYTVVAACDGVEALAVAERSDSHFDALVTDVVMPGASGPEVAATLVARNPELRVLFTSGYAEDAIARHGELTPGAAFLSKPFSAADLGAKLRELLDG
jgi:two-component system cell cycle sensor histidine kinase/response regulator CckA